MIRHLLTLTVALSFVSSLAAAALSQSDKQSIPYENRAASVNSGFENGISKWVSSPAITLASATPQAGSKYAQWDSTSAAQTLTLGSIGRPEGQLEVSCAVRVPSGTATHTFSVVESSGSTTVASMSIENSTTWRYQTLIFPSPSAGTLSIVFTSVAADEPSIDIDDCYVGRARNVGSTDLITEPVAYTPVYTGFGTVTNSTARSWRVGSYLFVESFFTIGTATGVEAQMTLGFSGTSGNVTTASNLPTLSIAGHCSGDTASVTNFGNITILQEASKTYVTFGRHTSGQNGLTKNNGNAFNNSVNVSCSFRVPIQGWAASTVVMPDAQGWYVDASISGANPSLGTASVTSYTGIENGSLTMTQNTGSAGVQIGCSSTNAPSGLTCSSGNESLSVAFTPPKTGAYRACVTANHYIDAPAGSINVVSTFQIVETATNAQTVIQEGKGKAMSGSVSISGDRREYRSVATCGDFVLSAGAQRMLRLMYETEISGTPDNHYIKADADSVLGQPDVHWTVFPLQDRATAILANSVSSASTNGTHFNSSQVGSTGTVSKETGDWVSGSCSVASAVYTCTLVAGAFSTDPACHATIFGETTNYNAVVTSASTSSVVVRTFDTANAAAAAAFALTCSGPR